MLKYNLSHVLLFFLLVSSSFSFLGMGGMGGAGGGGYVSININTFYEHKNVFQLYSFFYYFTNVIHSPFSKYIFF